MNLLERISTFIRATAGELTGGDQPTTPQDTQRLLDAAQKRVDKLNTQLEQAEAREKHAEQDWHDARALSDALEAEVNTAVRAGQDDAARAKLAQLNHAQINMQQLDVRWQSYAKSSAKLRLEITDLQAQLAVIRRRLGQASVAMPPVAASRTEPAEGREVTTTSTPAAATATPPDVTPLPTLDETRISDLLKKRDENK